MIDGNYQVAKGEEVGEGGLSLIADKTLPQGKLVLVTFALEDELHVIRGEVRYQQQKNPAEFLLGIAFQNISFKYKKLIRRYIGAKTEQELDLERQERAEQKA